MPDLRKPTGKPLTVMQERQKAKYTAIYESRKSGKSWEEVAEEFGLARKTCEHYCERAILKYGLEPFPSPDQSKGNSYHNQQSEELSQVIALAADPMADPKYKELREACKKAGMKTATIAGMLKRLRSTYAPVLDEAKRLTMKEVVEQLEHKTAMILGYMDDFAMSSSSLKDLSIALSVVVEKHQLLTGKPTAIIDMTTRLKINQLMPLMLQEAARRGITYENPAQNQFQVPAVTPRLTQPEGMPT